MNSFRQIVLVSALSLASFVPALGQTNEAPQYRDVLKQCGQEWKTSEARKSAERGTGGKAWQEFRSKCVKEKGWQGPARNRAVTRAA